MKGKILLTAVLAFGVFLTSCYPQLSVQQYDQLRKDIAALDVQRQALEKELADVKVKNTQTLAYVRFLEELKSTQSSEKLLSGQFDAASLISDKGKLAELAKDLGNQGDADIDYLLGLMKPDDPSQTVQAYYKIFEICLKKIRANLE